MSKAAIIYNCLLITRNVRRMGEIVQLLRQLNKMLRQSMNNLMEINREEKKKMKKVFFDDWNLLFHPEEEVLLK